VSLSLGTSKEWIFAFLTAMLSVLGWIYSSAKNTQREVEARLFSEKAELYKKIFGLFPDILKKMKLGELEPAKYRQKNIQKNQRELLEKMIDIKSELLIWGSDKTIEAWAEIEDSPTNDTEKQTNMVLKWGRLYSCMRADLGHKDYEINERDLIGIFLTADARKDFLK